MGLSEVQYAIRFIKFTTIQQLQLFLLTLSNMFTFIFVALLGYPHSNNRCWNSN